MTRLCEVEQFLLTDQVGTLRAVADSTGTIVKRVDYDSFGNIIADSNPAFSVPFGFAGGLHDSDTGLVRFGARDYSPELGRFVAKDPIDFAGGDTNLYAYSMSDPVNFVDPDGKNPLLIGAIIGGVVGTWIWGSDANAPESPETSLLPPQSGAEAGAAAAAGAGGGILLSAIPWGANLGEISDWLRWGPTVVSNQLVDGPGCKGASVTSGLKGGGTNKTTGFALPFRYHIHRYNWYKPWSWFKNTPILK